MGDWLRQVPSALWLWLNDSWNLGLSTLRELVLLRVVSYEPAWVSGLRYIFERLSIQIAPVEPLREVRACLGISYSWLLVADHVVVDLILVFGKVTGDLVRKVILLLLCHYKVALKFIQFAIWLCALSCSLSRFIWHLFFASLRFSCSLLNESIRIPVLLRDVGKGVSLILL